MALTLKQQKFRAARFLAYRHRSFPERFSRSYQYEPLEAEEWNDFEDAVTHDLNGAPHGYWKSL